MSAPVPFMSRKDFEAKKASGEIMADPLFPILDYDFCKQIWDTSPLIRALLEAVK